MMVASSEDGQLADDASSTSHNTVFYEDPFAQARVIAGHARGSGNAPLDEYPKEGRKVEDLRATMPVRSSSQPFAATLPMTTASSSTQPTTGCKEEDLRATMPVRSSSQPFAAALPMTTASSSTQPTPRQAMPTPPVEWAMPVAPTLPFAQETSRKRSGSHDIDRERPARTHTPSPRSNTPQRPSSAQLSQQPQEGVCQTTGR